ncbi:glycosyltransferase family 2 protein [Geminocystis sp. GBBB08]|uniref:glycosyltransferase family 2 protein n=1 Tax=Geminocystis sp. GBBB08 TaxID=2604140 RepID=UPI0027E335FC|nr:glycosyltransferase family 2 protein [Geminocystis sp. GBBB08]MBL1208263.1 glycosyltransferase family 2 protein [Geminocystis sp. GBBB08]
MITLLTTTYNRPQFLWHCAVGIIKQLLPPKEWIIYVDDDFNIYAEVLDKILRIIPYAKVLGGTHIGRVAALYNAHHHVETDYCGWVDDDDWLHPNCLAECSKFDADIIYTDFYEVHPSKITIGIRNTEPFTMKRMLENNILFHFRLFKTALYHKVGGIDLSYDTSMDYELSLKMLQYCTPHKVNIPLYYYLIHGNRISALYSDRQIINKNRARLLWKS